MKFYDKDGELTEGNADEVKDKLAKKEADEANEDEIVDEEEDSEDPTEDPKPDEDEDDDKVAEEEVDAWMTTDMDKEDPKFVPLKAHVKAKKKLRGKLDAKDDKIAELEAKIAKLENPSVTTVPNYTEALGDKPDELDFDDDDKYQEALRVWEDKRLDQRIKTHAHQQQLEQQKQMVQKEVDKHYERAEKLLTDNAIDAEVYKTAESNILNTFTKITNDANMAQTALDNIILNLGEGSEKTVLMLGRNRDYLNGLIDASVNDPNGLRTMAYLGQLHAKANMMKSKIRSKAPNPAPDVDAPGGDKPGGASERAMKTAYTKALKSGDIQKFYNARKKAKSAGFDVSKW